MPTIVKLPSGRWRAQVRRNKKYVSRTFLRNADATTWAMETELAIDKGLSIATVGSGAIKSFGQVIALHVQDMQDVGKTIRRSKRAVLESLKRELGATLLKNLNRTALIDYGKRRAKAGAGPATLAIDFSFIGTLLTDAAAVHGVDVPLEAVKLARIALTRLGLIGKSQERDRRPTQEELDRLIDYFDGKERQYTPMSRIIRFAVATAMRIEEICSVTWAELDVTNKLVTVRDRKDPRHKDGNHQKVPLLSLTGYDAWECMVEQAVITHRKGRIFPHHHKSVGTAFHRACLDLGIEDLHFHDLRHEAASRLFEAGLTIERVALVTGHKDWKMLKRYTNLKPQTLHNHKGSLPAQPRGQMAQLQFEVEKNETVSSLRLIS
jgi:integrase